MIAYYLPEGSVLHPVPIHRPDAIGEAWAIAPPGSEVARAWAPFTVPLPLDMLPLAEEMRRRQAGALAL